ncbi:MAG: hypothetical protein Q8R96_10745 [Bacteroidota bacterium]|nr:hypothetical protein [Bacteroidota bacterium]
MKTIIFILMLFVAVNLSGQSKLDLYKLTLNDSILSELTIEKLTDMLGRPSAVENQSQLIPDSRFGPVIFYHEKGLKISFETKNSDPQQRVHSFRVYLVKSWDIKNKVFFYPYTGEILPVLDANMKLNNILPLFDKYRTEVISADSIKKLKKEMFEKRGMYYNPDTKQYNYISVLNSDGSKLNLFCEELTKYLEEFEVTFSH